MRLTTTAVALLASGSILACDGVSQGTPDSGATAGADSGTAGAGPSAAGSIEFGDASLLNAGTVTFTISNRTTVPLALPGGMQGRWLEIGYSGYSLWPANSVTDNALCDADPQELGELPPPGGEIPVNGEHHFDWKANAFIGARPIAGMSEEYQCAATGRVPLGEHQFLLCARQANVACTAPDFNPYPPRLICTSTIAAVGAGHTTAEFSFDDDEFPTENCPQGQEIPD